MVHLSTFTLALILLPLVSAQIVEECPGSEDVLQEVCTFNSSSESAVEFRRKTRLDYNVTDKTDDDNSLAFAPLFSPRPGFARCVSKCPGIDRSDVTWCVRLANVDDTIEFCVSLGDGDQLVFNSTCNTEALGIQVEEHLSLPNRFGCLLGGGAGCLALNNLNWFFRDAYLTCISETENCRDVSFASILHSNNLVQPPTIEEPTVLPMRIQPADQIIIRAVITSSSPHLFINWMHNNITYVDHKKEDPTCPGTEDKVCAELEKHVTTFQTARVGTDCSTLSIIEAYLIIDSATESDAGTYLLNVTALFQKAQASVKTIDVNIECDETQLFKVQCSNGTIVKDKGSNVRWQCSVKAPHNSSLSVAVNNKQFLQKSDFAGKDSLDKICTLEEPIAMYDVVEEEQHLCYKKYTVMVTVCSAAKELVGNYSIVFDEGNTTQGSGVNFKLTTSSALAPSSDEKSSSVSEAVYIVPVAILILLLAGIIIAILIVIRARKRKRVLAHLRSPDPIVAPEAAYRKKSDLFSPVSLLSPPSASAAFKDPLEFPRNKLYVYTNKVLGEGSFGRVLQAKADGIVPDLPNRNLVAIKTTKDNATSVEIEELLAELDLMRNMEPHENILNLLGQCTTPGGPMCLIVEYARYGNLRDFLRQCEEVVLSLNHKPHIPRTRSRTRTFSSSSFSSTHPLMVRQSSSVFTPGNGHHHFVFPFPSPPSRKMSSSSSISSTTDSKATAHHPRTATLPLAHSVAPIGHDYINSKGLVYMEDVHNFALQIACGLQHLASLQIVHCDLAARNVLIAEGFVLKIADFGLARDISGREMYKKNPRGKIPVKWTAPEALENRIFTTKSDVWSYGVVLWELFTYGHTPYPDLHLGQSYDAIISYLKEGNRMSQPESCSDEFYELMLKCWSLEPDERPTPIDIVAALTPMDGPSHNGISDVSEVDEGDCQSNGVTQNGKHTTE